MNIANGRARVENPHPRVSIFNFHYCVPPDTVAINYGLNKVIGENETGFRGKADVFYRTEGWDFLIAGGAIYNNLDYSFTTDQPDGTFRDYKSPGGGSSELRQQLGLLKKFLDGFDLVRMQPDDSVLREVSPKMSARALVQKGQAYAIYIHAPVPSAPADVAQLDRQEISCTVTLNLPTGHYKLEWVNTRSGKVDASQEFEHAGDERKITSPMFIADIALRVLRRSD